MGAGDSPRCPAGRGAEACWHSARRLRGATRRSGASWWEGPASTLGSRSQIHRRRGLFPRGKRPTTLLMRNRVFRMLTPLL